MKYKYFDTRTGELVFEVVASSDFEAERGLELETGFYEALPYIHKIVESC